jgi:hypothetical protein
VALILLITLFNTIITAAIGAFIKFVIWGSGNKPKNALEYGRSWAAYIAFFIPMSTIHIFIKSGFKEGLIALFFLLVMYSLLGFILGFIYGLIKTKTILNNNVRISLPENDEFFEQALAEFNGNTQNQATLARALVASEGIESKIKSAYIKLRVESLNTQHLDDPLNRNTIKWDFLNGLQNANASSVAIVTIAILIFIGLVIFDLI